jgi:protein TonB
MTLVRNWLLYINRIQPEYPAEAKAQHISGNVRLHAIISTNGNVASLEVLSGDPLLAQAATEAVRQSRYRATTLNGDPVEVDTTIDVVFSR